MNMGGIDAKISAGKETLVKGGSLKWMNVVLRTEEEDTPTTMA